MATPVGFKVVMIGDTDDGTPFRDLLRLIKRNTVEANTLVLHAGDFAYTNGGINTTWPNLINNELSPTWPYLGADGNHDDWAGYIPFFQDRLDSMGFNGSAVLTTDNYTVNFKGIRLVFQQDGGAPSHLISSFALDNPEWRIGCWHKNQRNLQVEGKGNEQGFGDYEECRKAGAIILNGHAHIYCRTKSLTSMSSQTIGFNDATQEICKLGQSFVIVSGVGGRGPRSQQRCFPTTFPYGCGGLWSKIWTTSSPASEGGSANEGALFITFNVDGDPNKATAEFIKVNDTVIDTFTIFSQLVGGPPENSVPIVTITNPPDQSTFIVGESVTFNGTATDVEDGNIGVDLIWTSDLDGQIGTGTAFNITTLTAGAHSITATVTDSGSLSASDVIAIGVGAVPPPPPPPPPPTEDDTLVDESADGTTDAKQCLWGPYWIDPLKAVIVNCDTLQGLVFYYTTDGGVTWPSTLIEPTIEKKSTSWFDRETPGDTGTLVHVVWMDSLDGVNAGDVHYVTIDVANGVLGTIREIDGAVTIGDTDDTLNGLAITKTRNGNLIVAWRTPTEIQCVRSIDAGVSWTIRADVYDPLPHEDHLLLYPANTGDDADAAGLYLDASASELTLKLYRDSLNTWTEDVIYTPIVVDNIHEAYDAAVRHSDGAIVGAVHSDEDTPTDILRTFEVKPTVAPSIVTKTAVFSNIPESSQCAVFVNQQDDSIYVAYLRGTLWEATVDCLYKKSTDGMTSWSIELPYSQQTTDDLRRVQAGRTVGNDGGFFQPVFFNDDFTEIYVNLNNDVRIASITSPVLGTSIPTTQGTGTLTGTAIDHMDLGIRPDSATRGE